MTFILSVVAASTLMAQAPSTDVDAVTTTPAVHVQEANGVQYLSGGVGDLERQAMRSHQQEFPLQVLFSGKAGELGVANQVRVLDGANQVVAVQNAGPLLMLKLPPGHYTVEADFNGGVQRRSVHVGRGPQLLHWASALVSTN
jgi:hypothetical protein